MTFLSDAVPVPVLESLASEWEDRAARLDESAARAAERGALPERTEAMAARASAIAVCARQLREAMATAGRSPDTTERPASPA